MTKYTGTAVVRARATIRARGRYQQCWRCRRGLDLDADTWTVGHLLARIDGGGHQATNIEVECPTCNYGAGGREGSRRREQRRRGQNRSSQRLRVW